MSPFWILLELRTMEVVVTTGAIRHAKLPSNCHHQQTNTQFFTGRMPFLLPNKQCQNTEGRISDENYSYCILTYRYQARVQCPRSVRQDLVQFLEVAQFERHVPR